VVKVRGNGIGPRLIHWKTAGREEVEELTGSTLVPVLLTDSGEAISESTRIIEWAAANAS
jgi:glutathione S-transferase